MNEYQILFYTIRDVVLFMYAMMSNAVRKKARRHVITAGFNRKA